MTAEPTTLLGTTPEAKPAEGEPKPAEEPKAAEGEPKPAAEAKPAEAAAPEFKFDDLKVPEGLDVSDEQKEFLTTFAKDNKISAEGVQKLLDTHAKTMETAVAQSQSAWKEVVSGWEAEVKADPEIGGEKLPETLRVVSQALQEHSEGVKGGYDAVKDALNMTQVGSHPALIRVMYNMAVKLTEGKGVTGAAPPSAPKSAADLFYGNGAQ